MSRTTAYVLKAKDAATVKEWRTERSEGIDAFNSRLKTLAATLGVDGTDKLICRQSWKELYVEGYEQDDPKAVLPDGWRRERSNPRHVVPALRSKQGKANAQMLADHAYRITPPPGLPDIEWGTDRMGTYGIEEYDGVVFATLGFTPSHETNIDWDLWEKAKLSEYHAAKEAHEAAHPEEVQA